MIDDEQLAERLLEAGLIEHDQLRAGMRLKETVGVSLYETLAHHKLVEEAKLVELVAEMLNVRAIRIDDASIEEDVLGLVPVSLATRNRVIPLHIQEDEGGDEQLVLGMENPIDVLAMDEVATHTGIDIRPVLVAPAQLGRALERFYGQSDALDADALFADFDIDLDELEVGDDDSWAEYFDGAKEEELEDSAMISQEMRDRPSTDVLAVDEFGEVEKVDEAQLGEPLEDAFDAQAKRREIDLDDWEVDEAIANPREAQILSTHDAEELFGTSDAEEAPASCLTEETAVADEAVSAALSAPEGVSQDSAVDDDSDPQVESRGPSGEPYTRELEGQNLEALASASRDQRRQEIHNRATAQHKALPRELLRARSKAPAASELGVDPMEALDALPTEALLRVALRMLVEHDLLDAEELVARAKREAAGGAEG